MHYKMRKGVLLVECCGEYLLISTLEAREFCPYIMSLNEASAYLWTLLSEDNDINEITKQASDKYEIPFDSCYKTVSQFISSLKENGYIEAEGADSL